MFVESILFLLFCSVISCVFTQGVELSVSEICKKCLRFSGTTRVQSFRIQPSKLKQLNGIDP